MARNPQGPKKVKRVFLLDDEPAVRRGTTVLLGRLPHLAVCGESAMQPPALRMLEVLQPDLLIMDLTTKTGDGFKLIRKLRRRYPAMKILIFSMHESGAFVEKALAAGVHGYVAKRDGSEQLVQAIDQLLGGASGLGGAITAKTEVHSRIRRSLS